MSADNQPDKPESKLGPIIAVIGLMSGIFTILQAILPSGLTPPIAAIAVGIVLAAALIWSRKLEWQTAALTLAGTGIALLIIHLVISQPATVIGYLIANDGSPADGLALTLTNSNGIDQRAVTGQDGRFEIRNVPDGRYTITANARLLYTGEVPSGWQRIFSPSVIVGSLPVDIANAPTVTPSPTVTSTKTPLVSLTPSSTYTPTQTLTNTPRPTSTPRPTITPIVPGMVLLEEDFEDDLAQGFSIQTEGRIQIIPDETGNNVIEIFNTDNSIYTGFAFGAPHWENYDVEFRLRLLDRPEVPADIILYFRSDGFIQDNGNASCCIQYALGFTTSFPLSLNFADQEGVWHELQSTLTTFQSDTWYMVRVEAHEDEIRILVNSDLIISVSDRQSIRGTLTFHAPPQTHSQVDDIRVIAA